MVIDCTEMAPVAARGRASSDCGELNALAVQWVDLVDAELGHYLTASSLNEFQYETNLTEYNEQQVFIPLAIDLLLRGRLKRPHCWSCRFSRPSVCLPHSLSITSYHVHL